MFSLLHRKRDNCRTQSFCRLSRLEFLENRLVLSAPSVTDVNVCGTDWEPDFIEYLEDENLGTGGYSIPVGSSDQLDALPWINIDQIKITFSEDVNVQMGDLSVSGANVFSYPFIDFSYDSNTYTATWTIPGDIPKDKLRIDLDADGVDPITDSSSNILDGEWTDGSSTYNSGNSVAGGDFEFRFNILPGDSNTSASVTSADSTIVSAQIGEEVGDAGYVAQYDVDGDAIITSADYNAIYANIGDLLPSREPWGCSNEAPTTTNLDDILVARNASDTVISLWDLFEDAEEDDEELTYQVIGNSNPDLFDSVDIETDDGELIFDYEENISGVSTIIVRAIDSLNSIVDTVFHLIINDPPFISGFGGYDLGNNVWTFSGVVTDVDDDVEGMIVTLGGILASYNVTATVQANGTFSVTDTFVGLGEGWANAQTEDDDGNESNLATYYCTIS